MATVKDIVREDHATIGRYVLKQEGAAVQDAAQVCYTRPRAHILYVNHAGFPELREAAVLLARLVEDARAHGDKVVLVDKRVGEVFRAHPEWADVLAA